MNCSLCMAYLREKNRCTGCREEDEEPISITRCAIRACAVLRQMGWKFCSSKCWKYPCARLKALDKRYSTKYGMSMIENLEKIRAGGIRRFLDSEVKRWVRGAKVFCMHNKKFYDIRKRGDKI